MAGPRDTSGLLREARSKALERMDEAREHVLEGLQGPVDQEPLSRPEQRRRFRLMTGPEMDEMAQKVGHLQGDPGCVCELCQWVAYEHRKQAMRESVRRQ